MAPYFISMLPTEGPKPRKTDTYHIDQSMTLDDYIPQQDLIFYTSKDSLTQQLIQYQVLEFYLEQHELNNYSRGWDTEVEAIMYWDLKWYEHQEMYEVCLLLKTVIKNINKIAKDIRL